VNRADFQALADVRLSEAKALMACMPPHPSGAYYLAGYAVECALKACICKLTQLHDWPDKRFATDVHTHNLSLLIRHAQLETDRDLEIAANPIFEDALDRVCLWSEQIRYVVVAYDEAVILVDDVSNPNHGVLPWIKRFW
jgi:hypothetical protein